MANRPVLNAGTKYIFGLQMEWLGNTTISIGAGATRDTTNVVDIELQEALVGNIVTKLDTGGSVQINTLYAVYIVGDSTQNKSATMVFSRDFVNPSLPFGYDVFRRIGAVRTDGSTNILRFHQRGNSADRSMYYDTSFPVLVGGNATSYTLIDLATLVVAGNNEAIIGVGFNPASATNFVLIAPAGASTNAIMYGYGPGIASVQNGSQRVACGIDSGTLGAGIVYKVFNAGDTADVNLIGYVDSL